jgi:hypothetical protein
MKFDQWVLRILPIVLAGTILAVHLRHQASVSGPRRPLLPEGAAAGSIRLIDLTADLRTRDGWREKTRDLVHRSNEEVTAALAKLRGAPLFDTEYWGDSGVDHRIYFLDDAWQLSVDFQNQLAASIKVVGIADEMIDEDLYPALKAIHNAPRVYGGGFNPLGLIRAVNILHPMGKEKAIAALRTYNTLCQSNRHAFNKKRIFLIVRILFEPIQESMPRMSIGAPDAEERGWPIFPLTLIDDIPFMVCNGYSLHGRAESPLVHIEFAEKSCLLRAKPLAPSASPARAAQRLLDGHSEIKEYHRQEIRLQAMRVIEPLSTSLAFGDLERWSKFAEGPQPTWDGWRFK